MAIKLRYNLARLNIKNGAAIPIAGISVISILILGGCLFFILRKIPHNYLIGKDVNTPYEIMCTDISTTSRAMYMISRDSEASHEYISPLIEEDICRVFSKGTHGTIEEITMDGTYWICIRPQGRVSCYWTPETVAFPSAVLK